MLRYCPNCGTEVDETALFCPTCGQAIDQATETELPPAPSWPETEAPAPAPPAAATWDEPSAAPHAPATWDEPSAAPEAAEAPPPPPASGPPPVTAAAEADGRPRSQQNVPVTTPVTLSGWLIGGGAAVGALGALIGLFDGSGIIIGILVLVALVAIAVTVFGASALPAIPHLRVITLVVVLIAFGVALDRIGFGGAGIGTLLVFLGSAAAGIGGVILEIGRDEPLGGA